MKLAINAPGSHRIGLNYPVFFVSVIVILLFSFIIVTYPHASNALLEKLQVWISASLGWYYMLVVAAYLVFVAWLAFSRFGHIKLGQANTQPDFSYGAWVGMLFSSGIGISLMYFGASEPIMHYLEPPRGEAGTPLAARQAISLTFLHWGIHGWAIYALIAITLAYFAYRHHKPLALRSALYCLAGEKLTNGWLGHAVDCFGIIVTVFGLVSNLGIGALQISAGLEDLFSISGEYHTLIILMIIMTIVATVAAISGIEAAICRLSNLNTILFGGLLLYVLFAGPTIYLLNALTQNIGDYLKNFLGKTFDVYAYNDNTQQSGWLGKWTTFYWAWWTAWAPFVGLFIARISRGRTIREVIFGVLSIPLAFTFAWLSIFGNSALNLLIHHNAIDFSKIALEKPAMMMYKLLEYLPFGKTMTSMAIFIGFVLYLTPADSGAVMLADLSSIQDPKNHHHAPHWLCIFWGIIILVVTAGLMFVKNISAIQTSIVLTSLPFSVVLIVYMLSLYKTLKKDHGEYKKHRS